MTVYGDTLDQIFAQVPERHSRRERERPALGHQRVMYYADVLLMYAETRNELDDQATAAQYA